MEGLYEWQREAVEVLKGRSGVVSAPTGAGKTKVAYLWADLRSALQRKSHRVFYTVPIKALANEKYRELLKLFGDVGIQTGDVSINTQAGVLVCTQEVFTKAHKHKKGMLIVDEFHHIFTDSGRSRAYIDGLKTRMPTLIMSATMGDPEGVAEYLRRVSGKDFVVYKTDFRPTRLEIVDRAYTIEDVRLMRGVLIYLFNTRFAYTLAMAIADRRTAQIARRIKLLRLAQQYSVSLMDFDFMAKGVALYHGRLQYNEKLFIEECVREGLIDIIVATNALGVGVNLPVEFVLFAGFTVPSEEGTRMLTKVEFLQMGGRAGRSGFYDTGYVAYMPHNLNPFEPKERIVEGWRRMLDKPTETPTIKLSVDTHSLIQGVPVEEEVEYVIKNSLPQVEEEEEIERLRSKAYEIKEFIDQLPEKKLETLRRVYTPELTLHGNIKLVELILKKENRLVSSDFEHLCRDDRGGYYSLLKLYRVSKHLNRVGVEVSDLQAVVRRIQGIDPWVLVKQNDEEVLLV